MDLSRGSYGKPHLFEVAPATAAGRKMLLNARPIVCSESAFQAIVTRSTSSMRSMSQGYASGACFLCDV